jgi:hypothetical protein
MSCRVTLRKLAGEESPTGGATSVEPEGYYLIDSVEPGAYQVEVTKQAIVLGRVEHFGPTGASQATERVGREEVAVVGEVVVSPGRTAVLDFAVP